MYQKPQKMNDFYPGNKKQSLNSRIHHSPRTRSRSPERRTNDGHRSARRQRSAEAEASRRDSHQRMKLPYDARHLQKEDYERYKPLFALYLDLQKSKSLVELDHDEARGRWKSFVKRWNSGQLAEGWYDSRRLQKAREDTRPEDHRQKTADTVRHESPTSTRSSSEDELGPAPPPKSRALAGPKVPSRDDLRMKQELEAEEAEERRSALRRERRMERKMDRERQDELAPKAAAGTKERQMEKRREVADSNRAFAAARDGGGIAEVPEEDMMGDGEDGLQAYKHRKQEEDRKKTEKEMRREEIARARKAEREERVRQFQQREEKTMEGLMELARQRFG